MTRIAILIATLATPALGYGSNHQACKDAAAAVYMGVVDGLTMAPIIDGIDEAMTVSFVQSDDEARIVAASYLSGYSRGLLLDDPAEATAEFYAICISEDA